MITKQQQAVKDFELAQGVGTKTDVGKIEAHLLNIDLLEEEMRVLKHGKTKYSATNWKNVKPPIRYLDAGFRHYLELIKRIQEGNKDLTDEDSGLSLIAHIRCNLAFLDYFSQNEIDMFGGYEEWEAREKKHLSIDKGGDS